MTNYDKLVRDKVPELLRQNGIEPVTHVADEAEYLARLIDKLREETNELAANPSTQELADVLEVVRAIGTALGLDEGLLEQARAVKEADRGAFAHRVVLEHTETHVERVQSYEYARRTGVRPITWEAFGALTVQLAEALATAGIDSVVGIARAGLFPAVAVAAALRCNLHPVQLTRRENDEVVRESPEWKVRVPPVFGKTVAVVDDVTDSGETLAMVVDAAHHAGAKRVVSVALVAHTWARPSPDVVALTTDEMVVFPWDEHVLFDERWGLNPEIETGVVQLGETSKRTGADGAPGE